MRNLQDINRIAVLYHDQKVGTLAAANSGVLAFQYERSWLSNGFSISPLSLPLSNKVFLAKPHPLNGVFGVFADSLPDGWGRLLVDRTLSKHGINPHSIGPLARLSIVGSSGMGALEYQPETTLELQIANHNFDQIAEECAHLLETSYSEDLDELFVLGGSSGGARPKILTRINDEDWIIKFASSTDPSSIGFDEYLISNIARTCGITMSETRLFPSKRCKGYFGVKRFDRLKTKNNPHGKVHMISSAALLETSHRIPNLDYETLMRLVIRLTNSEKAVEQLFRLMCFNVYIGNRDDHSKNFSFLYDENHDDWCLAPAYDLTQNSGLYGEHSTTINEKGRNISLDDLLAVGVNAGLSKAKARSIAMFIYEVVSDANLLTKD